jgi:DNA-binding XRE family transcriptional regulator
MKTRIRQMRGLLGYTQEYTAKMTGMNSVSLSRMENEEQDPSVQHCLRR